MIGAAIRNYFVIRNDDTNVDTIDWESGLVEIDSATRFGAKGAYRSYANDCYALFGEMREIPGQDVRGDNNITKFSMSAFFESGIFKNKIALRGYVANPAEALSLFRNLEDVAPSSERPAWQKYDWNEICGLMWRWLAVEKPPLDDFALQTSLKNTVADALERDALPVPPDSQLMAAAKHLLDQYATSDITGPFRVKFGRGKSTRLGAVHKKT